MANDTSSSTSDPRRHLPSVERVVSSPTLSPLVERHGREPVVAAARAVLDELRRRGAAATEDAVAAAVAATLAPAERPVLRRVLNGTGVLLHTNLGRAPLPAAALLASLPALSGFADLEWDPPSGKRSERGAECRRRLAALYGAEAALVVTNNAAAVLLALRALAGRGEAIVSRGELVAIGGGFRIPEILRLAGCRLVEVGTTNRTRLDDFRAALGPKSRLILRATPSNFTQQGFVESPTTAELASLAAASGLPLLVDQGSGAPAPLDRHGLPGLESVGDSLRAGAGLVAASGDKLLGGPQAGIVVGRADLVRRLATDPLYRAIRPGRFTYALLGEIASSHLAGKADTEIPLYRMIAASPAELDRRGEALLRRLGPRRARLSIEPSRAVVGGGTSPGREVESRALVIAPPRGAAALAARLRRGEPPVAATVADGQVRIDLRSILPEEDLLLGDRLADVLAGT